MELNQTRLERRLFLLFGAWFVLLTFLGFSRSFFLRQDSISLPIHLVWHGVVYSAWVLLFLVQVSLISSRKVGWHRQLGVAAVVLLLVMIPVGFYTVLHAVSFAGKSVDVAGFNLTTLCLGFGLAFTGIAFRKTAYVHKRLMLFATMTLTVAAADRVAFLVGMEEVRIFRKLLVIVPGLMIAGFDAVVLRVFPWLCLVLLAAIWLVIYFVVSDWLFLTEAGDQLIYGLARFFIR